MVSQSVVSPEPHTVERLVQDLRPALRAAPVPAPSAAAATAATFADSMVSMHCPFGVRRHFGWAVCREFDALCPNPISHKFWRPVSGTLVLTQETAAARLPVAEPVAKPEEDQPRAPMDIASIFRYAFPRFHTVLLSQGLVGQNGNVSCLI